MEAYKTLENIREKMSDTKILDELSQYLSSDQLNDFCDHLITSYDLDCNEDTIANLKSFIDDQVKTLMERYDDFDDIDTYDDLMNTIEFAKENYPVSSAKAGDEWLEDYTQDIIDSYL